MANRDYFFTWSAQSAVAEPQVRGGHGVWLETDKGRYLDLGSLSYQAHLGFDHPRVVAAMHRQIDQLCMAPPNAHTEAKETAAQAILAMLPKGFSRVFFTLGGAEAVENAMKIARLYTGKLGFVARRRSYHGASMGALSLTGDLRRGPLMPLLPGVLRAADCYCRRCPFGETLDSCRRECVDDIDRLIAGTGDQVAAVVAEPVVGANGVLIPPADYWPKLRAICDARGALLVADEVLTGMGRTGTALAVEWLGGEPDIVVLGKGLTAGFAPLGAVVVHERIAAHFDSQVLWAGLTHYGHPLCCAAAAETLAVYRDENLFARAAALEPQLLAGLRDLAKLAGDRAVEVRGRGLLAGLELDLEPEVWARIASKVDDERVMAHIYPSRRMLTLAPPLTISDVDLADGLSRLTRALGAAL